MNSDSNNNNNKSSVFRFHSDNNNRPDSTSGFSFGAPSQPSTATNNNPPPNSASQFGQSAFSFGGQPSNNNNNDNLINSSSNPPSLASPRPPTAFGSAPASMSTQVTQPPPPFSGSMCSNPSPTPSCCFGQLSTALYHSCTLLQCGGRAFFVQCLLAAMWHDIRRPDSPHGKYDFELEANTALVAFLGKLISSSENANADDAEVIRHLISCADMDRVLDAILTKEGMNVRCYGALVSLLGTFAQNHENKFMVRDMEENSKFRGFSLVSPEFGGQNFLLYVFPKADNGIRFTQADTDYARDHPLATTAVVDYTRLHREQSAFGFSFSSTSNHAGGN